MEVPVKIGMLEFKFEKSFIEEFEHETCSDFKKEAEARLVTNYGVETLEEVFSAHSLNDIKEMIIKTAKQEIALYKGEI